MAIPTVTVTLLTLTLSAIVPLERSAARDAPPLRIERSGEAPGVPMPEAQGNIHNLLLNAIGRKAVPAGKVAIPIPGPVVTYEVIVSPPGAPRLIRVHR